MRLIVVCDVASPNGHYVATQRGRSTSVQTPAGMVHATRMPQHGGGDELKRGGRLGVLSRLRLFAIYNKKKNISLIPVHKYTYIFFWVVIFLGYLCNHRDGINILYNQLPEN